MSESQLTTVAPVRASDQLATFLGIEKGMMLDTLKAQCFKGKRPEEVSDAQLAAFVSTANALQVNPLLPGFLYAFPERNGGITPILGPDGVFKKLDEMISSGKLKGYKCDVKMGADGKPESATAIIQRGEGQVPAEYTAYFSEWCVTSNPNWQARPRHMIWVRAIKQAARQVIHGLPMDADEYEIQQMQNVTPASEAPEPPKRPPAPRKAKGAATVIDVPAEQPAAEAPKPETPPQSFTEAAAATPPAEAAPAAPAPEAPKAAEQPPAAPEPQKSVVTPVPGQPRAFLSDAEEITCEAEAIEVSGTFIKKGGTAHPGVKATLKGGYNGDVYHLTGGTASGEDVVPNKPWAKGAKLKVTLLGEKSAKTGRVIPFVQKVEAVEEEF